MKKFCLSLVILAIALLSTQRAEAGFHCYQYCSRVLCPEAASVMCCDDTGCTSCADTGNCWPAEW